MGPWRNMKNTLALVSLLVLSSACATGGSQAGIVREPGVLPGLMKDKEALCKGLGEKECGDKLYEVFNARLSLTYWAADAQRINLQCKAKVNNCTPPEAEALAIESHNSNIARMRHQEQMQRAQAAAHSLNQLHQQLAPRETKCVTTAFGAQLNTTCR